MEPTSVAILEWGEETWFDEGWLQSKGQKYEDAPTTVQPVDHLKGDIEALMELTGGK